ncbi:MAG TPA: hydroxyethylthiazole kinase [Bryobacteraceae bacterium]|nr:hydroxyethylthiazole kinase [Bryobacteraceae bacterium]
MAQALNLWNDIQRIRAEAPLIHNITNYVVMNTTANALLALGASPVMAHAVEEVEEMAGIAKALVLNIGTLSEAWIGAMVKAGLRARQRNIPVVLDPVGAGATQFRTAAVHALLREVRPTVIRGNASEMRAVLFAEDATKGVDSTHSSEEALDAARILAEHCGCVVSVSGAVDLVVGSGSVIRISNGHPMMPRVTGLGCTATALTGAFAAVNPDPLQAAAHAMAALGIAGEMAAERASGPGSLQMLLLDALYRMEESDIRQRLKMEKA